MSALVAPAEYLTVFDENCIRITFEIYCSKAG
jgi:hypothetical protein